MLTVFAIIGFLFTCFLLLAFIQHVWEDYIVQKRLKGLSHENLSKIQTQNKQSRDR